MRGSTLWIALLLPGVGAVAPPVAIAQAPYGIRRPPVPLPVAPAGCTNPLRSR